MMVLSLELLAKCSHHYIFDFSKKNRALLHREVNEWLISVNSECFPMQNFIKRSLLFIVKWPVWNPNGQQAE